MAKLIPADLGTHYVLVSLTVLATLMAGGGWAWSTAIAAVVVVGREVYGRRQRGRPMDREDWIESARDIAWGLLGGGVVLAGAVVGV